MKDARDRCDEARRLLKSGVDPSENRKATKQSRAEVPQVIAGQSPVVVDLAVPISWRGPAVPSVGGIENVGIFPAFESGLGALVFLKIVEIFQEKEPGGLLGIVEFGGTAGFQRTSSIFLKACSNMVLGDQQHDTGGLRVTK